MADTSPARACTPTSASSSDEAAPPPQDTALTESQRLDIAADQAIAACGGDLRSTIRALILANEFFEAELCLLEAKVSNGYARGRKRRDPGATKA